MLKQYTTTQARAKLFTLLDKTNETHEPIYSKGKRSDAVIISKEDYNGLKNQDKKIISLVGNFVKN